MVGYIKIQTHIVLIMRIFSAIGFSSSKLSLSFRLSTRRNIIGETLVPKRCPQLEPLYSHLQMSQSGTTAGGDFQKAKRISVRRLFSQKIVSNGKYFLLVYHAHESKIY